MHLLKKMSIMILDTGSSQKNPYLKSTFDRTQSIDQISIVVSCCQKISEEIIQKGYQKSGLKIGKYHFYNLGNTTFSTLKKYKIIPNKNYKDYEKKKPDALLVNRRNKSKPIVVAVIEHKSPDEFKTKKQKKRQ